MTSEKPDFFALIQDYVNDELSLEQRREFEVELAGNGELRREVEEFASFATLYREFDENPTPPPEHIFARIEKTIERDTRRVVKETPTVDVRSFFIEQVEKLWNLLRSSLWAPWMLAAAQAAVIVIMLMQSPHENSYTTLSDQPSMEDTAASQLFNVVFKPEATEADIRALLLEINGTIVSGPSAQGRYIIAVPDKHQEENVKATLERAPIVTFVDVTL